MRPTGEDDLKKGLLYTVALLTAGAGVFDNWERILLRLGAERIHPDYARAVSLTTSSRTFVRHHTNLWVIHRRIEDEGGTPDPDGWSARRVDDELFRVEYRGRVGERTVQYDFQVNLAISDVRLTCDDPGRFDPAGPPR